MNKTVLIFLFTVLLISDSCKKNNPCNNISSVYVDLQLNLALPSYSALSTPNNWVYVYGGNRGIIVFRKSLTEFSALDRVCTFDPDKANSTLQVQSNHLTAVDSTCGSKFQITDGSVTEGPASCTLITYRTEIGRASCRERV